MESASKASSTQENRQSWLSQRLQDASAAAETAEELKISSLPVASWSGREVVLTDGQHLMDFMSCSYLGLDRHPDVLAAIDNFTSLGCGVQLAAARTRLTSKATKELEQKLSEIFGATDAITFTSTTSGHLGILPILATGSLPGYSFGDNRPLILLDKTVHASIQILRAILAQFGDVERCNVFDIGSLEDRLKKAALQNQRALILTDGVFSYHGVAPVSKLANLADRYGAILYIDDAHGVSIQGKRGEGLAIESLGGKIPKNCIFAISMSKGFGTGGGAICFGQEEAGRFARKHAPTYVFGGPLFQPLVHASLASANLHLSGALAPLQKKLWENVAAFDAGWSRIERNTNVPSPIRTVFIGCDKTAKVIGAELQKQGVLVSASTYPVVAKGAATLRICFSSSHELEHINKLVKLLRELVPNH